MTKNRKCMIYGYDGYTWYDMALYRLLNAFKLPGRNFFGAKDLVRDRTMAGCLVADDRRIPHSDMLCSWLTGNSCLAKSLGNSYRVPDNGDSIYFMNSCKLPRAKFMNQWKRAGSAEKADSIVIPDFSPWNEMDDYALFVNKGTKELWIMDLGYGDSVKAFSEKCRTGDTFKECLKNIRQEWCDLNYNSDLLSESSLADSVLTHSGHMYHFALSQVPLLETLLGKHRNVVFESDLNELLDENSKNEFSVSTFENLYEQLMSNSSLTRISALKCLASLNYNKMYKNAVTLLLDMTADSWYDCKRSSVAVKQMCRDLGFVRDKKFVHHYYGPVSKAELEVFSMLYKKRLDKDITSLVQFYGSKTNAKVDISYNIKITL